MMKGQQAFVEVTHAFALMRKYYPYRPGHPGAHLCPAKSMVETPTTAFCFVLFHTNLVFGGYCYFVTRNNFDTFQNILQSAHYRNKNKRMLLSKYRMQSVDYRIFLISTGSFLLFLPSRTFLSVKVVNGF